MALGEDKKEVRLWAGGAVLLPPLTIKLLEEIQKMRINVMLAALAVAFAVAGCNTMPIQNVDSAPATNSSGHALTQAQVRGAIIRAGAALGWQMKDEGSNMIVGTLMLRKHVAVVSIPYSATSYSIKYRSSENLDEKNGQIHKNYNGWIQNLTRGINAQLSAS